MGEFSLNAQALMGITDLELAFGTTKLLPDYEQVPDEFKNGNVYTMALAGRSCSIARWASIVG